MDKCFTPQNFNQYQVSLPPHSISLHVNHFFMSFEFHLSIFLSKDFFDLKCDDLFELFIDAIVINDVHFEMLFDTILENTSLI